MENDSLPMNFNKAMEDFDNDFNFLIDLIQDFIMNVKSQINIINQSITSHDSEMVRRSAHSVKGGALNLRSEMIAKIAEELEFLGKDNNLVKAKEIVKLLDEAVDQLEIFATDKKRNFNKLNLN